MAAAAPKPPKAGAVAAAAGAPKAVGAAAVVAPEKLKADPVEAAGAAAPKAGAAAPVDVPKLNAMNLAMNGWIRKRTNFTRFFCFVTCRWLRR